MYFANLIYFCNFTIFWKEKVDSQKLLGLTKNFFLEKEKKE